MINLKTNSGQNLGYLVNCAPDMFYKPFEWGLLLLILFCSIVITLTTFYSRAWSYGGVGYDIGYKFIIAFNAMIIIGVVCAYLIPSILAFSINIIGSALGTLGVMVCTS